MTHPLKRGGSPITHGGGAPRELLLRRKNVAVFYGNIKTRSSGATNKGTPTQAVDYLQDDHDSKRMAMVGEAEIAYMARINPGYKTNLEGGRIPLNGYGKCKGLSENEMRAVFAESCIPRHVDSLGRKTTATTGYKSIVLTFPKELSLLAETDPAKSKEAMNRAIRETLERAYPGKEVSAVSSIHTRNANGEIHYHAHVLIAKFAKDRESGKVYSLGSPKQGGSYDERRIKPAWSDALNRKWKNPLT